jgi:transposase-like protein
MSASNKKASNKKASSKKNTVRGKRYSPEEKAKVVSFVEEYNTTNGRGGQSSAAVKFGISQLTISSWLKNAGVSSRSKGSTSKGGMQNKLATMLTLGQDIDRLDRELTSKRKKFEALKASL